MELTLTLPRALAEKLTSRAKSQRQSVEELACTILDQSLDQDENQRALEALVARIKALPPNPQAIRLATISLADYKAQHPVSEAEDEEFDQEEWQRNWDAIEQEMKDVTRKNNIAEGRG